MTCYEMRDGEPYVMGRHVAWHNRVVIEDYEVGEFGVMHTRVFHVPLENGITVSTVWGSMTYCDNRGVPFETSEFTEQPATAEMAAWWDGHVLLEWPNGESVVGYVPATVWWDLLDVLAVVPTGTEIADNRRVEALVCP